jgi:predicted aldo/keto reductase-like oxidoreductase
MDEARQNLQLANTSLSEGDIRELRQMFSEVPEHNCHNCYLCKCPFLIPVARFATYLEWRKAFGIAEELEETLRKEARRARDFVGFCDSCRLCDRQCPHNVPLSTFVKQAVKELG